MQSKETNGDTRILVVEDNLSNQMVVTAFLNKLGYSFDVAANGEEALQRLDDYQYPIVLMDCQMPVLDGFETTQEIRKREGADRHTVIIALTANAMKRDREACTRAGMDDFISKPMKMATLAERIDFWKTEIVQA